MRYVNLEPLNLSPLFFAAPFMAPWQRDLQADIKHRLLDWCGELLPGVAVEVVEWVGADARQPPHAVILSFPTSCRQPTLLYLDSVDIERNHLVKAFRAGETP